MTTSEQRNDIVASELMRNYDMPLGVFLDADNEAEAANKKAVIDNMAALMRVPTIVRGAVMPDACPQGGGLGSIPVGAAVACKDAIHPGFHSSDVCCSVAMTVLRRRDDPKKLLDTLQRITHFGPGPRAPTLSNELSHPSLDFSNPFLRGLEETAASHYMTQGDGNHFAFVGMLASTGQLAIVTHHGSRGFGAQVYKRGMAAAQRHTSRVAKGVPKLSAWLDANSDEGRAYWAALQAVRVWTRANHFAIHTAAARAMGNGFSDRFWNEHNFVFRRSDGLYYHGKGATPSWSGFSDDDDGRTLIPLNMEEPILIARHRNREEALGFAPHGAGRTLGRKAFLRENTPEMPLGIDVRFYCGHPDLSELPAAYKRAGFIRRQIHHHELAEIVDTVQPYGCIMAGDLRDSAPWRRR